MYNASTDSIQVREAWSRPGSQQYVFCSCVHVRVVVRERNRETQQLEKYIRQFSNTAPGAKALHVNVLEAERVRGRVVSDLEV